MAQLDKVLTIADTQTTSVLVCCVSGTAGVGKTALVLHWGHRVAHRFPHGQLYVNLRGFDPVGVPMSPAEAVQRLLTTLDVPAQRIPADLDGQIALYRSQLAGRRMLVVLDNARDVGQVRPLLPGSPGSLVVVTSRNQLFSLVVAEGALPLTLDLLTDDEARDLLVDRLGAGRVAAEPAAVQEITARCARLPLALAIVAARAASQPGFPLAAIAEELRDAEGRLDTLTGGDTATDVRAAFFCSYDLLSPPAARLFRLLGIHRGPDISAPAAASLAGIPNGFVRPLLVELARAHLITEVAPARYALHDLLRVYGTELAHTYDADTDRRDALGRVVDHYLHSAHAADRLLAPHRHSITLDGPVPGAHPHPLPDQVAADAWLDSEHACLLAAQQMAVDNGWYAVVWQLAWTLHTFHHRRGYLRDKVTVWKTGLAAARQMDDSVAQIRAHRVLGRAYAQTDRHADAAEHLRVALLLAEQSGDLASQADTQLTLGQACELSGDDEGALGHAVEALHLYQALDSRVCEAVALNAVGWYSARLGRYGQAQAHLYAALALHDRHHDSTYKADTLDSLGYLAYRTGQHTEALQHYHEALALLADLGDTYGQADTLNHLGDTYAAIDDHDRARGSWYQALRLYEAQHRTTAASLVRQQLDHPDRSPEHR